MRLRIAWGGGEEARRWIGQIRLTDGTLADMQLLGMEADAAGSIWRQGSVIYVDALSRRRFDGFDVSVAAPEDARLTITLATDPTAEPVSVEIPIADAARRTALDPFSVALDQQKRIVVHRSPGDTLGIEMDRDTLIFAPDEDLSFVLRPMLDELAPGKTIDVTTTLSPARSAIVRWKTQQRLPVPPDGDLTARITVPLPQEEGVYSVRVSLAHAPGYQVVPFLPERGGKPFAERTFQVAVLTRAADLPAGDVAWQTVLETDPANPRWWQKWPSWAQNLPVIPHRPLGSIDAKSVEHPLGRFVELPTTEAGREPHWQAYALPIQADGVGTPHLLEVDYPADGEQHLGLSIVEPNAAGRVVPIGRDSGVYVEGLGQSERTDLQTHRLVFWPRTNSPLLLVTNLHPTAAAHFGKIRVRRAFGSLAGAERPRPWRDAERLVMSYVARPLVPETFGASEGLDPASGQSVDDLQTFYEAAVRLAEYSRYGGHNGAVVNVMADGSTVYPGRRVAATPLYNTGRMVTGANDLPEADALEMLLTVFDRQKLALVPGIQLAAPLPELELLRRSGDPRVTGLEWVGADGRTWLETHGTSRGLAPYYNLLNDRVQQAVLNVVAEIVNRYGDRPALAGLAVQLSSDGYGQLPGLAWGFDDATVASFERDTGIRLPSGVGPQRFAVRQAALVGEHADEWRVGEHADDWRAWRAARVTRFYARLAELVRTAAPGSRLFLTTEEMFSAPRLRAQLQPNVQAKVRLDQRMLDVGIDRHQLDRAPGIVLCLAKFIESTTPLVDRAADLEFNEAVSDAWRRADGDSAAAAMFFHRPVRARLASFDAKSPWPSSTWLVSQSAAEASAARRRFALALDEGDPAIFIDGGELLPMGQELATRRLLRALQQLPTQADVTVHRQQPVTVRSYATADSTMLVVVNECPWWADVEMTLEAPSQIKLEVLTADDGNVTAVEAPGTTLAAGQNSWPLRLGPYDVQVARLRAAPAADGRGGVRVAGVRAQIGDAAKAELAARVAELGDRDLTKPRVYDRLANPGFEPTGMAAAGDGPLPGWQLVDAEAGATAKLDPAEPHSGTTSLYLASGGQLATVQSHVLPTPPTGQLFLTAYLRGENLASDTELRMVIESGRPDQLYRRFIAVSAQQPAAQPVGEAWSTKPYGFWVNDLPLDSEGQMRVKFELDGKGEVWVDDVQLQDLLFPRDYYQHQRAEKKELAMLRDAVQKAQESGRVADCVRLLEGYWPRFLMAYTPPVEAPTVVRQTPSAAPNESTPPGKPAEATPSASFWKRLQFWR